MMNRFARRVLSNGPLQVSNVGGTRQFAKGSRRREQTLSRNALKSIVLPIVLVCLAGALPALFMMRRAGPDLFDLTPTASRVDGYMLVAWYDLKRTHGALKAGDFHQPPPCDAAYPFGGFRNTTAPRCESRADCKTSP